MPGAGRIAVLAVLAALAVPLGACVDMAGNTNAEVVNSTRFDTTPCKNLRSIH